MWVSNTLRLWVRIPPNVSTEPRAQTCCSRRLALEGVSGNVPVD